jgi:hypothetical protein
MAATALSARTHALDTIILAEFDEMPGMRLTMAQVCRLWRLQTVEADRVIRSLVAQGVLAFDRSGRVCRPIDLMP